MRVVLPMLFYCARHYLLADTREQLLPTIREEHIGIEVPDLGNDDPRHLRFLREAVILTEGNAEKIAPNRAEERLNFFAEVWPEEIKRRTDEEEERRRTDRKRNDPWPPGSLFNREK